MVGLAKFACVCVICFCVCVSATVPRLMQAISDAGRSAPVAGIGTVDNIEGSLLSLKKRCAAWRAPAPKV